MQKFFNKSVLSSLILLFSCGESNLNVTRSLRQHIPINYDASHFFVVAHPDDWQLFMGEYAYDLIKSSKTKVTIVLTNAGDAGKGTAYWKAREDGSLASVRAALNLPIVEGSSAEKDETLTIADKKIRHHTIQNVDLYFFRLPDGFPDGSGSGAGHNQSMLQLLRGDISSITSIDSANTFSWKELQDLLRAVVDSKRANSSEALNFYTLDPGSEKNFSHSDHLVTQELARSISPVYVSNTCKLLAFEDYRIKKKTSNIDKESTGKKALLFSAYDMVMLSRVGECNICMRSHYEWLLRSYHREFDC